MKKTKNLFIILVIIFASFVITSVLSYAFFTTRVSSNGSTQSTVVTGTMKVEYDGGSTVTTLDHMYPGDSVEKTFSVKNIGNVDATYDIYLNEVVNTFNTKSDLVYELISSDGGRNISESECPSTYGKIATNVSIEVGQTHHYILRITFKETNISQDNNRGKEFSAKVELEENTYVPNAPGLVADKMRETKDNGSSDLEYDGYDTLGANYGTADNNLRYIGTSPKNYVYFNCSTTNVSEMNDETCEKWRIIGLFNNVKAANGVSDSRVKIIRDEMLNKYSWDSSSKSINYGDGINQWAPSGTYEGADLMRELNTDYLGEITVGTSGKWYSGAKNAKGTLMPTTILNENAINMIQTVNWDTGWHNSSLKRNVPQYYKSERSKSSRLDCSGVQEEICNDGVTRTSYWIGKVALMYPSDVGYSTVGGDTTSREQCLEYDMANSGTGTWAWSDDCGANTWLIKDYVQWTLMSANNVGGSGVEAIYLKGQISTASARFAYGVRPTIFLKSDVNIVAGKGTQSNPYKLSI